MPTHTKWRHGRGREAARQRARRNAARRSCAAPPLLLAHGGNVSTSQIATGIAEGTVFRAFKDMQDLLLASMRSCRNSDDEVAGIEAIDITRTFGDVTASSGRCPGAARAPRGRRGHSWSTSPPLCRRPPAAPPGSPGPLGVVVDLPRDRRVVRNAEAMSSIGFLAMFR